MRMKRKIGSPLASGRREREEEYQYPMCVPKGFRLYIGPHEIINLVDYDHRLVNPPSFYR